MKSGRKVRLSSLFQAAVCAAGLVACGGGGKSAATAADIDSGTAPVLIPGAAVGNVTNPLLFATQVPTLKNGKDTGTRAATFSNHLGDVSGVVRGGDLMIRYPDGTLRNLTKEARFGMDGLQGGQGIAVREPSVHWSGKKALFSMVVGAPSAQYQTDNYYWQMYEVSGLGKGESVSIAKVAGQPAFYNNVSPIYGTDDRILFTSDRPRGGESHLYPQLDEYENMPTITGIWSLSPTGGDLRLLNHAVSGAFSPMIDSYGRVIFTRWDHLQRDQQAEQAGVYGAFNFSDEGAAAAKLNSIAEQFPEPRVGPTNSVFGPVAGYTNNLFTPWQINEDGTDEETLNHIGRQELLPGLQILRSFTSDPALSDDSNAALHLNKKTIRFDGGLFHVKEDPIRPGLYYGIYAREFGTLSSNQIVRFNGGKGLDPTRTSIEDFTPTEGTGGLPGGRFRSPLPLSDGRFVATHTPTTSDDASQMKEFVIKQLTLDTANRFAAVGPSLTGGITKSVSWWDPDVKQSFSGRLWELEPVEVVARARPTPAAHAMEQPERSIFTAEAVDETAFRNWMKANGLALIVTRNQTTRDRADVAQPYNLQVPNGTKTVGNSGKVYDISHFQILQADQIRGYSISPKEGRRPIAQPMHDPKVRNPANVGGPAGSVKIAADGSTAAFVPSRRALAWQTTDAAGNAVVRERVWITVQPGEVRVCASCHGVNSQNQAGLPPPTNPPEALRDLLRFWKSLPK
jgi:hypothetical protein